MPEAQDKAVTALMELLIRQGPDCMAEIFGQLFNLALRLEREQYLEAGLYERTSGRRGYANGYKTKRLDTPAGTISLEVPKTKGHDGEPFSPQSLESALKNG